MSGNLPAISSRILNANTLCYDMMYSPVKTTFNQWAEHQGVITTLDGRGMLVEQAAESFLLWRGIRPKTEKVLEQFG